MPKRSPTKKTEKPSLETSSNTSSWISALAVCVLLLAVTLVVYFPVRQFDFLNYDDPDYVAQNPIIQQGLSWQSIKWAFTHTYSFNWHPITWISHMLDCQMFGVKAGAHHMVNVVFHLLNTLLVFVFFRKMTSALWPSAFVAAVFALHPLHVESVAWVCERKDVLSTFFWLLTSIAYVFFVECKKRGEAIKTLFYGWALFFFALGLMSKPMLVTLPFTLLLLDFWPLNRISGSAGPGASAEKPRVTFLSLLLEKIPFFALTVASSLATFLVQRSEGAVADTQSFSIGLRIANAFISYVRYLGKTFWPEGLMIFYPYPETWETWKIVGSVLVVAVISAIIVWQVKRCPFLFVGWFWFLGTLVPVIGLVQVGIQSMADRYMYVPMIGVSVMVAWGIWGVANRIQSSGRIISAIVFILLTAACLAVTKQQLRYWKDSVTVFERAITVLPNHVMAHVMAGNAYNDRQNAEKAIYHYTEALKISPNFAEVYYNLGNLLIGQNKMQDAISCYEKALQLRPDYVDARANLAYIYSSQRRNAEALEQEEAALQLRPDDPILLRNMSVDLMELKRFDEAERHLTRAIQVKPDEPVVYKLLGDVLMNKNKFPEAAIQYRKALELKPDFTDAQRRLDYIMQRGQGNNSSQ